MSSPGSGATFAWAAGRIVESLFSPRVPTGARVIAGAASAQPGNTRTNYRCHSQPYDDGGEGTSSTAFISRTMESHSQAKAPSPKRPGGRGETAFRTRRFEELLQSPTIITNLIVSAQVLERQTPLIGGATLSVDGGVPPHTDTRMNLIPKDTLG